MWVCGKLDARLAEAHVKSIYLCRWYLMYKLYAGNCLKIDFFFVDAWIYDSWSLYCSLYKQNFHSFSFSLFPSLSLCFSIDQTVVVLFYFILKGNDKITVWHVIRDFRVTGSLWVLLLKWRNCGEYLTSAL